MNCYTMMFSAIFTKGNNFYDFLFASLDNIALPKLIQVFNHPTALRMAKTPQSFGHSECKRVKGRIFS